MTPPSSAKSPTLRPPLRHALYYAIFASLWILLSDHVVEYLTPDNQSHALLQTIKGLFFVSITALLYFFLERNNLRRLDKAHQALAEREDAYRALYENAPIAYQSLDEQGHLIDVNPAWEETLGYPKEEVLGKSFAEFLPEREKELFKDHFLCFKDTGSVTAKEFSLRTSKGDSIHVSFEGRVGRFPDGSFRQTYCVFKDITEERAIQLALEKSEERFRRYIQLAPIAVFVTNDKGEYTDVNPAASKLLGYERDEILRQPTSFLDNTKTQADNLEIFRQLQQTGEWSGERRLRHKNGTRVPVLLNAVALDPHQFAAFCTDLTTLLQTEQRLRQSEERFRKIVHNAPTVAIQGYTPDGTVFLWNKANETIYGYTAKEALGQNLLDLIIPPEMRATALQNIAHLSQYIGPSHNEELTLRRKDGTPAHVYSHHLAIQIDNRTELYCIDVDLAPRIKAEQQLRQSEERFRRMFLDLEHLAVQGLKADGTIILWNKANEAIYGYTEEEALGKNLFDLIIPQESRPEVEQIIQRSMRQGYVEPNCGEYQLRHKNGHPVYVFSNHIILPDEGASAFFSLDIDLTTRRQHEQRLQHLNAILRSIRDVNQLIAQEKNTARMIREACHILVRERGFQHAWIALYDDNKRLTDFTIAPETDSTLKFANELKTDHQIHCHKLAECSQRAVLVENPDQACGQCTLANKYSGHAALCSRLRYNGKDYGYLSVAIKGEAFYNQEEIELFSEVADDIAFALATIESEQARQQATEELQNAMTALEHANRAKDEFLAVMSHELRTPLNPILGLTDLMLELTPNHQHAEYLNIIRDAGSRQLDLIESILHYTKLDRQIIQPKEKIIELMPFAQQALNDTEQIKPTLNYELMLTPPSQLDKKNPLPRCDHFRPAPANLRILTDSNYFRQILDNLLSNAAKYTQQGHVHLHLYLCDKKEENPSLNVTIADTGIGMAPETIQSIFDPFTQADTTYTRRYEGLGLGLAIAQKLAQALGGAISVQSIPAQGSHFTLHLPARIIIEKESPTSGHDNTAPHCTQFKPFSVLLAEDRPDNAYVARLLLEHCNGHVTIASNGEEAVHLARHEGPFDLMIIDLAMPLKDGLQTAHEIRELPPPHSRIPLVALTADASPEAHQKSQHAGFNDLLTKPLTQQTLYQTLSQYLPAQV